MDAGGAQAAAAWPGTTLRTGIRLVGVCYVRHASRCALCFSSSFGGHSSQMKAAFILSSASGALAAAVLTIAQRRWQRRSDRRLRSLAALHASAPRCCWGKACAQGGRGADGSAAAATAAAGPACQPGGRAIGSIAVHGPPCAGGEAAALRGRGRAGCPGDWGGHSAGRRHPGAVPGVRHHHLRPHTRPNRERPWESRPSGGRASPRSTAVLPTRASHLARARTTCGSMLLQSSCRQRISFRLHLQSRAWLQCWGALGGFLLMPPQHEDFELHLGGTLSLACSHNLP